MVNKRKILMVLKSKGYVCCNLEERVFSVSDDGYKAKFWISGAYDYYSSIEQHLAPNGILAKEGMLVW